MAKTVFTLRAKSNLNNQIPKGFTLQVISNYSMSPQISEIVAAVKAKGITNMNFVSNYSSWEITK